MWRCSHCNEEIDDGFDTCWKCGTGRDGTPPAAEFRPEPADPAMPDVGPDPEPPPENKEDLEGAHAKRERMVELCSVGNVAEANVWCDLLEEADIEAEIVGESLGAGLGLPLAEPIATQIWVHQSDVPHAREILDQWRRQQEVSPPEAPDIDEVPERQTPAEEEEEPIPSDVRFRFVSQAFGIVGLAVMLFGGVWAWQDWMLLSNYPATTEAQRVGDSHGNWKYSFLVGDKVYSAAIDKTEVAPPRLSVSYDPRHPDRYMIGSPTPPWLVLVFALGIGGFLMFVAYQFR